jgi:uncharacterized membrane protein AbrB (regulator of aidB expression)
VYFLVATLAAIALSTPNIPATRIIGAVIAVGVLVFWIIDAFKLPKLAAAAGVTSEAKTNE